MGPRRASPLHAARAGATMAYGLSLVAVALAGTHPLVLGTLAVVIALAALRCGVGHEVARAARLALVLAALIALVNALVVREGLTVVLRLGGAGPLGEVDVTAEALVSGLLLGGRVVVVVLAFALLAAVVDADALLRLARRASFRSALTAVLALRIVPVLARDARRMDEACRCRSDAAATGTARGRLAVVRALAAGALDRAVDVAATLELRGYAARRPAPRERGEPWSRHDLSVAGAAAGLTALALWVALGDAAAMRSYPRLEIAGGAAPAVLCVAIALVTLAPLAARRGIAR